MVSLVSANSQQIEADFICSILLNSLLNHGSDLLPPARCVFAGTERNRPLLQPIQLIKVSLEWNIGGKVVHIVIFRGLSLLHFKRLRASKAVMSSTNHFAVAHRFTPEIGWEILCECFEFGQLVAEMDALGVHHDIEQRLCTTSIIDDLLREIDVAILNTSSCRSVRLSHVLSPFEKENQSVHRSHLCKFGIFHGYDFLHLSSPNTKIMAKLRKHSRIRLNSAPTHHSETEGQV
mmetsp:Transcript_19407/g.40783  ORF Transcript_19407/g.40783 Transcript_19407/m.40783 type:complete len:234 (+) Transcript_19407:404-1105(+)